MKAPIVTKKQAEILCLIAQGCTAKEIAEIRSINVDTVNGALYTMRQLFTAETNAHLVTLAYALDVIDCKVEDAELKVFYVGDQAKLPRREERTAERIRVAEDALKRGLSIAQASRISGADRKTIVRRLEIKGGLQGDISATEAAQMSPEEERKQRLAIAEGVIREGGSLLAAERASGISRKTIGVALNVEALRGAASNGTAG